MDHFHKFWQKPWVPGLSGYFQTITCDQRDCYVWPGGLDPNTFPESRIGPKRWLNQLSSEVM